MLESQTALVEPSIVQCWLNGVRLRVKRLTGYGFLRNIRNHFVKRKKQRRSITHRLPFICSKRYIALHYCDGVKKISTMLWILLRLLQLLLLQQYYLLLWCKIAVTSAYLFTRVMIFVLLQSRKYYLFCENKITKTLVLIVSTRHIWMTRLRYKSALKYHRNLGAHSIKKVRLP